MKILGNEIKPGMIIEHRDDLWSVLKAQHVKPGKGGAFNQVELKIVKKGTKVNEAKIFANESGVDAIAISVGNTHLQTNKNAVIDIKKIIDIQNVTNLPLVLHGSSGIDNAMRKNIAKNTNVAKFNIGTELRSIFGNSLRSNILKDKKVFDRLKILTPTIKDVKIVAKKIFSNIGPANE